MRKKWTLKRKRKINCNNPKGFSQKQYCKRQRRGENIKMPVRKVKGGYRWGKSGKVYKTKKAAERQGRAIYASGYGKKKKKRSKKRNR